MDVQDTNRTTSGGESFQGDQQDYGLENHREDQHIASTPWPQQGQFLQQLPLREQQQDPLLQLQLQGLAMNNLGLNGFLLGQAPLALQQLVLAQRQVNGLLNGLGIGQSPHLYAPLVGGQIGATSCPSTATAAGVAASAAAVFGAASQSPLSPLLGASVNVGGCGFDPRLYGQQQQMALQQQQQHLELQVQLLQQQQHHLHQIQQQHKQQQQHAPGSIMQPPLRPMLPEQQQEQQQQQLQCQQQQQPLPQRQQQQSKQQSKQVAKSKISGSRDIAKDRQPIGRKVKDDVAYGFADVKDVVDPRLGFPTMANAQPAGQTFAGLDKSLDPVSSNSSSGFKDIPAYVTQTSIGFGSKNTLSKLGSSGGPLRPIHSAAGRLNLLGGVDSDEEFGQLTGPRRPASACAFSLEQTPRTSLGGGAVVHVESSGCGSSSASTDIRASSSSKGSDGAPTPGGFDRSWGSSLFSGRSAFSLNNMDDVWQVKNTFLTFSSPPMKPIRSVRTAEGALCSLGGDDEDEYF